MNLPKERERDMADSEIEVNGGIVVYDPTTNLGMGNLLNGNNSNLGVGQCSSPRCSGN